MKLRSLLALALAALLVPAAAHAAPAPAKKAAAPAPATPFDTLSVGGFIGFETDDLSGIALRLDGDLPYGALSPQVYLSWVGSIGYSYLSDSEGAVDITAHVLKIIPAARFSFPINPQLTLFADGGLGLYYVSMETETTLPFLGTTSFSDSETNLMLRIGGGAWYAINPTTRIGAAIEFDPYFGDFDQTTFIIQAGAMFKL
jgi:ABC-type amino acid transport substrate-binding protein